ncbi:MAG: addiction module protein [Thermodesulfobacteriota bacterium]|nr:addiction module protein [Thermodesulfobacteriota bacterium]
MFELLERIENEALSLSTQERAFLADRLLSSLDENNLTDIDAAWIAEAERRYEEYKQGKRPGIPSNQVFAEADRIVK